MICRLGLLVVVATCASAASALPPCVCTRELKPVCGSDGQTYNNMCLLACQQHSQPGLQLDSYGRCRSVRRTSDDCTCTFDYSPVCASNGRTYPNRCAMDCEGDLEILHEGECRSKREVAAERICLCPYIYAPVCGTDGETYPSECSLKCAENVKVAHTGECRVKREANCICPLMYAPVCGTDGKTYANECAMDCERTGQIKVAHHGACRVPREVEDEPPVCFCTYENDPVCGTNGRTYANMCSLECEGETVQVAYKGDCRAKRESIQIASLPACLCSREAKPVCGTDGKTYSNPCLLNCIKELTEDLDIDHPGPCRKQDKVREANPEPVCSCTRNLQPVCASNGVSYNNECLMRCAGEDLTVEKYGRCDEA